MKMYIAEQFPHLNRKWSKEQQIHLPFTKLFSIPFVFPSEKKVKRFKNSQYCIMANLQLYVQMYCWCKVRIFNPSKNATGMLENKIK